jgi:hypothetical protein
MRPVSYSVRILSHSAFMSIKRSSLQPMEPGGREKWFAERVTEAHGLDLSAPPRRRRAEDLTLTFLMCQTSPCASARAADSTPRQRPRAPAQAAPRRGQQVLPSLRSLVPRRKQPGAQDDQGEDHHHHLSPTVGERGVPWSLLTLGSQRQPAPARHLVRSGPRTGPGGVR